MVIEDKRKYPRFNISFPVECIDIKNKNYFYTVTKDLSLGGIKIINDKFLPKDSSLKININFIDNIVSLKAKVAWCNKMKISERYFAGLNFVEINKEDKENLSHLLNTLTR